VPAAASGCALLRLARPRPARSAWCGAGSARRRRTGLWVADFTYVPAWSGMVYVAFVIDAYSRQILGWRAATAMRTALVLDALEQAIWTRQSGGAPSLAGLICHHDAGSQ
jgi:putative transposase